MANDKVVKICHAALDELPGGDIVLRGVLDNVSLKLLKVGDYQREVAPLSTIEEIIAGFHEGKVPDIELGVRGSNFVDKDGCFFLSDDVYIVDGLQRVSAALHMLATGEGLAQRAVEELQA